MGGRMTKKSRYLMAGAALVALQAMPASAGEEILYDPHPEWVDAKPVGTVETKGSPLVLVEQQVRFEDGTVTNYTDAALRLSSPEALTQVGTLTAQWMPDKGDLSIHRVELIREGAVIDVIAGGARFEALRRERQLEKRIVDGMRTATLALPGARVGDVVRLAYSVTTRDQALGDEMQWQGVLLADPVPLESGSITVSWPVDQDINWRVAHDSVPAEPQVRGGYRYLSIDMPVAKRAEMPSDAPMRYLMPPMVSAGTFADWREVSSVMAPHYLGVLEIEAGSDLARQVEKITAATAEPLARAALATQLVQDEISYLLNGMNGGNYIPQTPAETWQQRYGDCKAKSVLLAALLRAMDIEAEPMLVRSSAGDAVPEMLPLPGAFDHVIVRASIDGTDYWLDGTDTGARIDNIATVPAFHYGLPLRAEGADLIPLTPRVPAGVGDVLKLAIDSSAGISVPALFDIDIVLSGSSAAPIRGIADQVEGELLEQAIYSIVSAALGDAQLLTHELAWDEEAGVGRVTASGLMTTPWRREQEVYMLQPPGQPAADVDFSADRARAAWRDIPLRLNGPLHQRLELTVKLPDDGVGYTIVDGDPLDQAIAGIEIRSKASLEGARFALDQSVKAGGGELAAADIAAARRETARLQRQLPRLRAPSETRARWQYSGADRKLLRPLEKAFADLIAQASEDELALAYTNRASFRTGIADFAGARADLDKALELEASTELYYDRAAVRTELGDLEGALSDLREAEALDAKGESYGTQVILLGQLGRAAEAVELARDYALIAETAEEASRLMATALMWEGNSQEALDILAAESARRPGDPSLLNAQCWEAGIWQKVDGAMLDTCTRAVEKSDWSAMALDSRAMAYFRMGRYEEARADLDAALAKAPEMAESRFMRGVVRLAKGEAGGREDVEAALRMKPSLAPLYTAYGITP